MKFLIDRCAGHRLALWLCDEGHDVLESKDLGPDPGDRDLLKQASEHGRILVTIDKDYGEILFVEKVSHCGLVRLPDVRSEERKRLFAKVLQDHSKELEEHAIITVTGDRIRVSRSPRG